MQPLGAGKIEKGLVDRDRLDQRRQLLHQRADLLADADIFLHVRPNHGGVRAEVERLVHRHGRADAVDAGDVAAGRDDAAFSPADDHRLVGKARVVALLDRGVEGVAIDMGDGKRAEFRVGRDARAAAGAATRTRCGRQAVAAEAGDGIGRDRHDGPVAAQCRERQTTSPQAGLQFAPCCRIVGARIAGNNPRVRPVQLRCGESG